MTLKPPPIIDNLIDNNLKASLPWVEYFNQTFRGDLGSSWQPTFTNLTEVGGAAIITGAFYQITKGLCFFRVDVTPVTSTSSMSGSTYIEGLPLQINANGFCLAVTGTTGGSIGSVSISDGRIYTPGWATVTGVVTVLGLVEAS